MLHDQNLSSSGPRTLTQADAQMLAKAHVDELFARQIEVNKRANRIGMMLLVPVVLLVIITVALINFTA